MTAGNGGPPQGREPDQLAAVLAVAVFLLRIEREERLGLSRRNAVLAAAAGAGVSPAAVLRGAKEVMQ